MLFKSRIQVIVNEHLGRALEPNAAPGALQVLTTANYILNFTFSPVAQSRTLYVVDVTVGVVAGSVPVYFLPWRQNAATTLTIPAGVGGPNIFMTSMLSGCTVQVHGTAASPIITHANARQSYSDSYTQRKQHLQGGVLDDQAIHDQAEVRGNQVATGAINNMLPVVPGGTLSGTVRKTDYAGRLTPQFLDQAKSRYYQTLDRGERFTTYEEDKIGGVKPRTGAFVYGIRNPLTNNWAFYYQAEVEVNIQVASGFGWGTPYSHLNEAAVLGLPTQFFP